MKLWKIEYMSSQSMNRFKSVEADMVRVSKLSGDMWFCNNNDIDVDGNYQPKMIVAKGTYICIERVEPKVEPIIVDFTKEIKRDLRGISKRNKVDWI